MDADRITRGLVAALVAGAIGSVATGPVAAQSTQPRSLTARSLTEAPNPSRRLPADVSPEVEKPQAVVPTKTDATTVVVVEGNQARALTIDTTRVVDFGAAGAAGEPAVRPAAPGEVTDPAKTDPAKTGPAAQPDGKGGHDGSRTRGGSTTSKSTDTASTSGSTTTATASTVSPVFLDANGRTRALPGGVIVGFDEDLSPDAATKALIAAGAKPSRQVGERTWLIESAPGLPTLELAERLTASGRFAFVQPNWWQRRTTK